MEHTHHFILDPPEARTSMGRCECGEERLHHNFISWEETYRNNASKGGKARMKAREKPPSGGD